MPRRKKNSVTAKPTAIYQLLARLEDVIQRHCDFANSSEPGAEVIARVLYEEARLLERKILTQPPQTHADTGILALEAFNVVAGISNPDDCDEELMSLDLVREKHLREIRFMIDQGTIDLRDPLLRERAMDILCDESELFPELVAKRKKAA